MSQPAQPLGRLRPRWFLLTGAIIALGIALAACGQDGTSGGPTATEDVFEDSTGFKRPTTAFERRRIPDTPGPRRVLLPTPTPMTPTPPPTPTDTPTPPPTPTDTPTPPPTPTPIPYSPGSPLALSPVPELLDCEYLRQNQGTVGVLKFTIQGDQNPENLNDYLEGTEGKDAIDGGEGNDVIYGFGGNDIICGGPGMDTIYGDDGADRLYGEAGQDVLYGGAGNDILLGGPGNDGRLDGGPGADWLHGGDGNDWLEGGSGKDILFAGMGDDDLYGDNQVDTEAESCLAAEPCADWLFGGFGNDQLHGGPGNDSIVGDIFPPKYLTNTGSDTPYPPDWLIYVDLYEGDQLIQKGEPLPEYGNDQIRGNHGDDWLWDPGSDVSGPIGNVMNGAEGNDILIGGENHDNMWGGYGDDKLWGRGGDDSLVGGVWGSPSLASAGYDELYGGAGGDSLSAAEVKIGGPGDDLCHDDQITFEVECDDD
jgi:Ca2+-binding RTX toxin-like protein